MMKRTAPWQVLMLLLGLALALAACAPEAASNPPVDLTPAATLPLPPIRETPTHTQPPTATLTVITPTLKPPQSDEVSVDEITSFASLPGNQADGGPAPNFSARLMGGGVFTLSEHRGEYWLVLPTSMGCGECMYSLSILTQTQPLKENNLNVLVLDIYESDDPEYWNAYLSLFDGLDARWSVVNQASEFMANYNIFGLGSFIVIDPQGQRVYQSDSPPRFEYIRHMFTLANSQGNK